MTDAELVREKPLPPVRTESARFAFAFDLLIWRWAFVLIDRLFFMFRNNSTSWNSTNSSSGYSTATTNSLNASIEEKPLPKTPNEEDDSYKKKSKLKGIF